ncbi:hypothetical protein Poli38472_007438 [Pythium oligandrum]|uniref:Restriction endonuclease type IV Mrr domain-containing protein n=1 Tax=Pythium oligandrum TaxID=41045 RepID=A0A8K1CSC1_PYTOL|nr:hypothetical protein Poli38472_007438 [Pythium oligandrum]|eukprot:TMW67766.1 hypothetical protein Poli38472_007438 [Pythium oligandrum]
MTSRTKGLEFEARVVRMMQTLHCHLTPTQVSMDGGIDHVGHWKLPDTDVEVVTQCKNEQKPVGVQHLREFHGVLALHAPTAIGLFFSASGYSIYAQRFFTRTTHPAILCTLDEHDRFTAFYLNDRARAALPKLSVGSSFVHQQHELILTYGELVLGS